jgi:UDP-2-acetamido-3-amino-2,3-dideoxy-glucuronate N-acetyltransferase
MIAHSLVAPEEPALISAQHADTSLFGDVTLLRLPQVGDARGDLTFGEIYRHVPFEVKRFFLISGVPDGQVRGQHAHRAQHHFLVCAAGSCHVIADDAVTPYEFVLDSPTIGLHIPPLVWDTQFQFSPGSVLLVLASDYYDPADYIRDYTEFQSLRSSLG